MEYFSNLLGAIVELSKDAALLVAIVYLITWRGKLVRTNSFSDNITFGILLGTATLIGMATPIQLADGIIFDARSVLIGVGSALGGPVVALIAGTMAAIYRIILGGAGMYTGLGVIVSSALLGFIFQRLVEARILKLAFMNFLGLGFILHLVTVAWFLTIPDISDEQILKVIGIPMLIAFTPATAILCHIIMDADKRILHEQELRISRQKFKNLFLQASEIFLDVRPTDLVVTRASEAAQALIGSSDATLVGKKNQ
jgi:LytS/YehU family sensor histidine kinase